MEISPLNDIRNYGILTTNFIEKEIAELLIFNLQLLALLLNYVTYYSLIFKVL